MFADYLFGCIAFDSLGAGVPVGDDAGRGERVDGVIRDTLHQKPKLLLALAQRIFSASSFRQVARDFCEANDVATGAIDRINDDVDPKMSSVLANSPPLAFESPFLGCDVQRTVWQRF